MSKKPKKDYYSVIMSVVHVSESEIASIYPEYNVSWLTENIEDLKSILFDLGMDTSKHFELQEVTQHRNRLGKVVTCGRYLGEERSDSDWLKSGYASPAAKDKSLNSRLTDDLWRSRGLTIDMQAAMERKDMYSNSSEEDNEVW